VEVGQDNPFASASNRQWKEKEGTIIVQALEQWLQYCTNKQYIDKRKKRNGQGILISTGTGLISTGT